MSERKIGKNEVTRRRFLQTTGGAALAGVAAGTFFAGDRKVFCAPMPEKWDEEFDLVVVGAGGAGFAASIEAAAKGAKVLILEKTPVIGGSSIICGGALTFAGTDMQAAQGIKDSNELLYKDLMKVGENMNVPSLVQAYVDNQLDTYVWLKELGAKFLKVGVASGMSVPRGHYVKPGELLKILSDEAKAKGVSLMMRTPAKKLVMNDKTGRIAGVIAEGKGKPISFGARKAVILASGGFSLNKELLAKFVPAMAKAKALNGLGNQGDGLKMAWGYGADIQDMPYIKATFGFDLEAKTIAEDFTLVYYQGGIIVNKEGRRFVNESVSYKLVGDAALVQTDAMGFQLYDEAIREKGKSDPLGRTTGLEERGRIHNAPTLAELAKKMGVPAEALEQTVREYNADIEKGGDTKFGRTTLVASFGKPVKIEKPPFYAFPSTAAILGTYGGILTNDRAEVLDVFGTPIPGLYAAGEITGGVHGAAYMTGTAFGKALIFGRLAAKTALKS
jgi:fumarate reductase flavoprotein subunit